MPCDHPSADRHRAGGSMAGFPTVAADRIAWLTEGQMIEFDRMMIEDLPGLWDRSDISI